MNENLKITGYSRQALNKLQDMDDTWRSPELKRELEFKHYNNSYIWVTFRKEVLKEVGSSAVIHDLMRDTKDPIRRHFDSHAKKEIKDLLHLAMVAEERERLKKEKKDQPGASQVDIKVDDPETHEGVLALLPKYNLTYRSVDMKLHFKTMYLSYAVLKISDKTPKNAHKRIAKIIAKEKSVLAVDYL